MIPHMDTRNTKPKLYHLAVLAVLTAAAMVFLLSEESASHLLWANILLAVFFALMIICLVDAFRKQLEYNLYSYNTIIYSGFALFDLFLVVTHIRAAVRCAALPESFSREAVLLTLLNSAKSYMLLTAPFLFIFAAALFVSNLSLIRHEGRRFVNLLGILLSVLLVGGEGMIYLLDRYAHTALGSTADVTAAVRSAQQHLFLRFFVNLSAAFYLYFECMILGTAIAFILAARVRPAFDKQYLIVLGCGLMPDGTPTPLLRGRVDMALSFYRQQLEQTGLAARFVVSGGQGPDEVQSEAASMRDYLLSKGIPAEAVLMEDRSNDTAENMRFSREVILADAYHGQTPSGAHLTMAQLAKEKYPTEGPLSKVAFFTTNYHVFRAGLKGRRVKMRAQGMGASTKWYFWPNAAVREFVGLLTEHRLKQGLLLGGIILGYAVLTILVA